MSDKPDKRPTLRSLAEITGLGISTVSQALRDSPEIAEETRKRVQLAARQSGYRPNRAGVRLRTGKTNVITVVLNPQDEGSGFFADFVYGISDGLADTSYHLVVTPYSLTDPMAPIRYIVETASADGVIFSRAQPDDPRVRYLTDHGFPFATHGRTEMGLSHPYYDYDNETFAFEALRLLADKGRKRIALLAPPPELTYYRHTCKGYERGLAAFGLSGVPLGSVNIETPLPALRDLARDMAADLAFDGVVCSSVTGAVAFGVGLAAAGMEIGRHVDVVAKSSTRLLSMTSPEITFVPEDFRRAGRNLARLVIAAVAGEDASDLQILSHE